MAAVRDDIHIGDEVMTSFVCPITTDVMRDPVILPDGHTYERKAIERCRQANRSIRSPMTREVFANPVLISNIAIRSAIAEYKALEAKQTTAAALEEKLKKEKLAAELALAKEQRRTKELQQKNASLEADKQRLKIKHDEQNKTEEKLAQAHKTIETKHKEIVALQRNASRLNTELHKNTATLNERILRFNAEIDAEKAKTTQSKVCFNFMEGKLREQQAQIEALTEKNEKLKKLLTQSWSDLKDAKKGLLTSSAEQQTQTDPSTEEDVSGDKAAEKAKRFLRQRAAEEQNLRRIALPSLAAAASQQHSLLQLTHNPEEKSVDATMQTKKDSVSKP